MLGTWAQVMCDKKKKSHLASHLKELVWNDLLSPVLSQGL